jgi:hypothetical protein
VLEAFPRVAARAEKQYEFIALVLNAMLFIIARSLLNTQNTYRWTVFGGNNRPQVYQQTQGQPRSQKSLR